MSATVADIREQLKSSDALIAKYHHDDAICAGLASTLATQVGFMTELELPEALKLTTDVTQSRFSDASKDTLSRAIVSRAMVLKNGGATGGGASHGGDDQGPGGGGGAGRRRARRR